MTRNRYEVLLLLFVAITLAACGNNAGSSNEAGGEQAQQQQDSEHATTRVFTDMNGAKDIPVAPERIFSISATTPLLALGVTPSGGLQYELEQDYYLRPYTDEIEVAGDYPPNMEAIAALQPDLIIASSFVAPDIVEQLEKIAPTVLYL